MTHLSLSTSLRSFSGNSVFASLCVAGFLLSAGSVSAQRPLLLAPTRTASLSYQVQPSPDPPSPEAAQDNGAPSNLKDDLFAGTEKFAKGATDATEVNMDPDSLRMVGGANASRARRTLLNVVRTYSYEKPGMYNPADVEEYRRKLEGGDWHCSVHTRDLKSGESTDICSRRRAPDLVETAIITMEPKELTFIHTIRKADGEGGRMNGVDMDGLSSVLPPDATWSPMLAIGPKVQAEMLASQAKIEAEMATMSLKSLPSLAQLQQQLGSLNLKGFSETKEMQQLEQSLRELQRHTPQLP